MDSLFVRDGGTVRPTEHAASPWNPATEAGGAPAALLAQLVEEQAKPDLRSARVTVDLLGPVPMAPGRVRIEPVRRGRATELVDAAMEVDGRDVVRLGVWRIAPAPPLPDRPADPPPTPGPDELPEYIPPQALFGTSGYVSGVLDHRRFLSIDVDITVHLERDLRGPWLYTDAITHVENGQTGHVTATLYDEHGRVGRATQTLLVVARA